MLGAGGRPTAPPRPGPARGATQPTTLKRTLTAAAAKRVTDDDCHHRDALALVIVAAGAERRRLSAPFGPRRTRPGADATRPGPQAAPAAGKEVPTAPATYFSSGRRSSWSLRSSSSTRWPKGSEEMDTMLESVTLLSLLPVRTSWSCEWL